MRTETIRNLLTRAAVAGDILFVLWILFNGMDEGWRAKPLQIAIYVVVVSLLLLNGSLLIKKAS